MSTETMRLIRDGEVGFSPSCSSLSSSSSSSKELAFSECGCPMDGRDQRRDLKIVDFVLKYPIDFGIRFRKELSLKALSYLQYVECTQSTENEATKTPLACHWPAVACASSIGSVTYVIVILCVCVWVYVCVFKHLYNNVCVCCEYHCNSMCA